MRSARLSVPLLLLALAARALGAVPLASGPISFQGVPVPDEVPAHLASALAQDRDGFLWIGTQGGLVRYDGYQFRVYKNDPRDPHTLSGSYVRTLFPAADGRLWVGTFSSGLSVYDPATEAFTRYQHDPKRPGSLSNDRVEAVAEDRSGRLWIATYEGLDRLDPRTGRIESFRHDVRDPRSLAADQVRGVLVDRAGQVWVGSQDGLQVWRGEGKGFERQASDPRLAGTPASLAGQLVSKLYEDARGRIWIGTTEHGAALLDPRTGQFTRLLPQPRSPSGLSHFWVYGFAEVASGEIWVATFGGGIDVVDPDTLTIVARLRHDPARETSVGGDRIGAILRDRSGLVWVGTWGHGIAHYDPTARAFQTVQFNPDRPDGLSHPEAVRALPLRDGSIWVGTNGNGIDILAPAPDGAFRRIGGHRPDPADPGALADGSVTCLAQATDGTLWVATLNGMLHRLRPGAHRFERLAAVDGLPGGPIRTLAFGPDGALWAGAAQGLARLDPESPRIVTYRHREDDPSTLSGTAVEALAWGRDGTLWVGTESGLNAFDPRRGTAVRILAEPGRTDGLPANWVPDLMFDRSGRLWVATHGGACLLKSWDGRIARFEPVAPRLGRPPGSVEALLEDAQGQVWLGPRLRVDPASWRSQDFGPADGCELRNFFIASRSRTADGALLFGSPEGLLVVRPERIAAWTYAPPVVATALRVDGRGRPARRDRLTLQPKERGFRLDFAALDFTAPGKNLYRYRLDGFDDAWQPADASQRSLAYTSLPPGDYRLRVQGTNRAGLWSPHEIRLPVLVLPAFYQTAAFRAGMVLLVLALVYAGVRLRVRRLEARGRELERVVQERTLSLAEKNRELERAYVQIEDASLTDTLTRLRNRRFLEQTLESDLAVAARRSQEGSPASGAATEADLVFLLLDLDHFKSVNDVHGHAAGDAVLTQTADLLRRTFREADSLVRWGGEEFLVVVRFCDRRDGPELAEKLRAAMEGHDFRLPDGTSLPRTCSIGFAAYPFSPTKPRAVGWEKIVDVADLGLYAAKRSGRNGWVGIEMGDRSDGGAGEPEEILRRFREDPEAAVAKGEVQVYASRQGLRWG